jgi:hypothetical protein
VVYPTPELEGGPVLEHGTTKSGRWLRANRVKIAIWIAVAEGLLIIVGALPRLPSIFLAIVIVGLYFWLGRRVTWDAGRHAFWIAAASQALVALIPILVIVVGTFALIAVGFIAVIALILLFTDRG